MPLPSRPRKARGAPGTAAPRVAPGGRRMRVTPGILGPAPPEILRGSGATVYGQIEDWLAEAIGAGRLAPGDRMPSEQDLAAWFGVSRMTLRQALAKLARRGLGTRTGGGGGGALGGGGAPGAGPAPPAGVS